MKWIVLIQLGLAGAMGAEANEARRDPFVRPGSAAAGPSVACGAAGLSRMRARDVAVKGIVRTRDGALALVGGADGQSQVARVGDRVCDGSVVAIEPDAVIVREDPSDDGRSPARTIRLRLHAE